MFSTFVMLIIILQELATLVHVRSTQFNKQFPIFTQVNVLKNKNRGRQLNIEINYSSTLMVNISLSQSSQGKTLLSRITSKLKIPRTVIFEITCLSLEFYHRHNPSFFSFVIFILLSFSSLKLRFYGMQGKYTYHIKQGTLKIQCLS